MEGQLDLRLESADLGLSAAHDLGGIVRGGGVVVLGLRLGEHAIRFVRIERRHVENTIARHQHARHRHLHGGFGRQRHRVQCTPRLLRLLRLRAQLLLLREAHHWLLRLLDCLWRRRRCAWKQWVEQCGQSQYERRAEEVAPATAGRRHMANVAKSARFCSMKMGCREVSYPTPEHREGVLTRCTARS